MKNAKGVIVIDLNHNPFLPLRDKSPVIFSAVNYLWNLGLRELTVLDPTKSLFVIPVLQTTFSEMQISCSSSYMQLVEDLPNDHVLIMVFADNVYPKEFLSWPDKFIKSIAVIREVSAEDAVHLNKWDNDRWKSHHCTCKSKFVLSTPWIFTKSDAAIGLLYPNDLAGFFNEIDCQPKYAPCGCWRNLGIPELFTRYWNSKNDTSKKA